MYSNIFTLIFSHFTQYTICVTLIDKRKINSFHIIHIKYVISVPSIYKKKRKKNKVNLHKFLFYLKKNGKERKKVLNAPFSLQIAIDMQLLYITKPIVKRFRSYTYLYMYVCCRHCCNRNGEKDEWRYILSLPILLYTVLGYIYHIYKY